MEDKKQLRSVGLPTWMWFKISEDAGKGFRSVNKQVELILAEHYLRESNGGKVAHETLGD